MKKFSYCIASGEIVAWEDFKDIPGVQFDGKYYRLPGYILIDVLGGKSTIDFMLFHPDGRVDGSDYNILLRMNLGDGSLSLFGPRNFRQKHFTAAFWGNFKIDEGVFIDMIHKVEKELSKEVGYQPRFVKWLLNAASFRLVGAT